MTASSDQVHLVDCTLREGDQTAGVAMTPAEKLALARSLDAAGVTLADAGMPELGEAEREFLQQAVRACDRMIVGASVRCRPDAVDLALGCGVGAVFVICPVSDLHLRTRLGSDLAGVLQALSRCSDRARAGGCTLEVVAEDATRARPDALLALVEHAAGLGADRLYVADTVGCLTPLAWAGLLREVLAAAGPRLSVGVHAHDDLGLATANTVVALELGVRWPTATVNGLGERCGNADLGSVALAARRLGLGCAFDLTALPALAAAVSEAAEVPVAWGHPLVGANAFRHESGIHVDGVLKDPATYESVDPAELGRWRTLLVGRHSGRNHLRAVLAAAGLHLGDDGLDRLRERVQEHLIHGANRGPFLAWQAAGDRHRETRQGVPVELLVAWAREEDP